MKDKLIEFLEFRIAQENQKLRHTSNDDVTTLLVGSLAAFKEIKRFLKNTMDDE